MFGTAAILNQLVAGSIIVKHCDLMSFPLLMTAYFPMQSTHTSFHGVASANFGGSFLNFSFVTNYRERRVVFGFLISEVERTEEKIFQFCDAKRALARGVLGGS